MKESSDPLDGRQHTAAIGTAKLPPNDLYRKIYTFMSKTFFLKFCQNISGL